MELEPVFGFGNNKGADQTAHMQTDQRLCYLLIGKYNILQTPR